MEQGSLVTASCHKIEGLGGLLPLDARIFDSPAQIGRAGGSRQEAEIFYRRSADPTVYTAPKFRALELAAGLLSDFGRVVYGSVG
jgi:hypothetical protein